ncbi:MAG: tRNA 5-methoxyuridine(34)/uridine 5-oxyacetic acid(34) synthase CmoB [Spirochaetales bacterium]|nr:tRNA 5-methoxyuridine(34)/uridine 5-oxyacetic acid(34) synthase CmoB [Leptospiraceae bacterium]MCP5481153.1 tRNA 5-methoxyuridine(34)/uridine 5-oxyacetic acid(34) synthase CmoB [Spirochaetales bacterium]
MSRLTPENLEGMLEFARSHATGHFRLEGPAVTIGRASELNSAEHEILLEHLQQLRPWRKGPFEIFGHRIDANWKSDIKWDRVAALIQAPAGATICDVGCNNGYYLFRLAALNVREVVGLDPVPAFQQCYEYLAAFYRPDGHRFVLRGYDWLHEQPERFDVILLLGVLYHHTDPLSILRAAYGALKPGGQLIVESLGLPMEFSPHPLALVPDRGLLAGVRGVWFVPNALCLELWLRRSGFRNVQGGGEYDGMAEQQRTIWADMPVGADFVGEDQTIEGYPIPVRLYASARR